jgi:hypothetical protein
MSLLKSQPSIAYLVTFFRGEWKGDAGVNVIPFGIFDSKVKIIVL